MRTIPCKAQATLGLAAASAVLLTGCGDAGTEANQTSGKNAATGKPITVGFVNSDKGGFAVPEVTKMAQAAAAWVNNHGGIHGRPLKLRACSTDGTPAASTKCANELVTGKVLAVLHGSDLGLDAAVPVYKKAGLHIFGATGTQAAASDADNTFMMPPAAAVTAASGGIYKDLGIRNGVYVLPNVGPEIKKAFGGVKAAAAGSQVRLSLSLVAPANPDVTAAVNAAKTKNADGLILSFQENDCTNAVRTAKTLGWQGELVAGNCTQFIKQLGAQAAGVKTTPNIFPYGARASAEKYDGRLKKDFDEYESAAKAAGQEQYLESGYGTYGYSTVRTFANILNGIDGGITQATVNKAIATFKGHQVLGTPQDCTAKLMPGAACGRYQIALEARSDGTQTVVGGKLIDLRALAGKK